MTDKPADLPLPEAFRQVRRALKSAHSWQITVDVVTSEAPTSITEYSEALAALRSIAERQHQRECECTSCETYVDDDCEELRRAILAALEEDG